ncbi:hypothetical protein BJX68DRAFT_25625 [Aspergillus pseudodeflectus]|uniref:Zn(2)-C6 fungal-type domain-containing protein n=1 Tax=Aspergillus pseudodeflectus TaxID=176178 RepID=A0ABR4JAD9_9EURO
MAANARRSLQACTRCRQQKMKCSGDAPCDRCAKFGRECVFEPANTVTTTSSVSSSSAPLQQPLTPSDRSNPLNAIDQDDRREPRGRKRSFHEIVNNPDYGRRSYYQPARYGELVPEGDTPYSTVQGLEEHQLWTPDYNTIDTASDRCSINDTKSLASCLADANITVAEAHEMFALFGERMAPFIPTLYATDFGRLPAEPVYALATIYTIARYLPDSTSLRGRVGRILRPLLADLVLSPATSNPMTAVGNMHGLAILYGCSEATGPSPGSKHEPTDNFDMLTLKGIAEAYAVKTKLGVDCYLTKVSAQLPLLWVVWLYTMSHHCAVIHGCPRPLSGSAELLRAKALLEQSVDHPRIRVLLGECDLFLLWEKLINTPGATPATIEDALHTWNVDWQRSFTSAPSAGRHLQFHFFFTRFHLLTHLLDVGGAHRVAVAESLDAAQEFLQCIRGLSPIAKDRLRYLGDFAFVLMAYVSLYILRALASNVTSPGRKTEFLQLVNELGSMMQSLGPQTDTRPCVYGVALRSMCKQHENSPLEELSPRVENVNLPHGLVSIPSLTQGSQTEPELSMPANATMDPAMLSQSRYSTEIWGLSHDMSIFEGLMAGIPVPDDT